MSKSQPSRSRQSTSHYNSTVSQHRSVIYIVVNLFQDEFAAEHKENASRRPRNNLRLGSGSQTAPDEQTDGGAVGL